MNKPAGLGGKSKLFSYGDKKADSPVCDESTEKASRKRLDRPLSCKGNAEVSLGLGHDVKGY